MSADIESSGPIALSTNAIDHAIAGQLKQLKQERNLSDTELARLMGVTPRLLNRFEQAQQRIPASRLMALAHAVDVPIGFFFEPLNKALQPRAPSNVVRLEPVASRLEGAGSLEDRLLHCFGLIQDPLDRQLVVDLATRLAPECHSISRG